MNATQKPSNQIVVMLLAIVAAALLALPAYKKLTGDAGSVQFFQGLEMEPAGRIAIGGIELACILLLLIPGTTIYGAMLSLCVMIGALIGHVTHYGLGGSPKALVVAVCCLSIIYLRRRQVRVIRAMFET